MSSEHNPHLRSLDKDHLHHITLVKDAEGIKDHDGNLIDFGDVKFVLTGGSSSRLTKAAHFTNERIYNNEHQVVNLCKSDRFVLYKIGQVLCVNHGMGIPSMSICLNEIFKLLTYAGCTNVAVIRIGTSGGIGVPPGTVIVSNSAMDGQLRHVHQMATLGQVRLLPALFDKTFINELTEFTNSRRYSFRVEQGTTMGTDDFYEGQGRLDGFACNYSEQDRLQFLKLLDQLGVRNIEMEAPGFAALTHRARIKGAIVCTTILNRLEGDQVTTPEKDLKDFENRPIQVVLDFIKHKLQID